jgi:large subunit ribosomal protein L25
VEVLCLPTDIPAGIDVDVSELMVGDSIHVRDLPAEGFEFLDDVTKVIAQVAAPTVEKVAEEEAEEAEEAEEGAEAPAEGEKAPAEGEKPADAKGDGE